MKKILLGTSQMNPPRRCFNCSQSSCTICTLRLLAVSRLAANSFVMCILLPCLLVLSSCAVLRGERDYLPAEAMDKKLTYMPLVVDLTRYQPVQSPEGRPWQRPDLVVVIAASGGGYRAANLTAGVLMGLEDYESPQLNGRLLDEVDYFSTVSGGGFGVGAYLAMLRDYLAQYPDVTDLYGLSFESTLEQGISRTHEVHMQGLPQLTASYTSQMIANLFKARFIADIYGGELLEQQLEKDIFGDKNEVFRLNDIFIPINEPASKVKLPYWVANATIFQNGAIFPFTPDILARYKIIKYRYAQKEWQFPGSYADPQYGGELPVVVGMRTSANFPIAVPPTTLVSAGCEQPCYLHLLDGGLADNLGVNTALNLLERDKAHHKLLIVIDAYRDSPEPYSASGEQPGNADFLMRLGEIGIDSARNRLKSQLRQVARSLLCSRDADDVLTLYLDIDKYPEARAISTSLDITASEQQLLLQIGKELVENARPELDGFFRGDMRYQCL